MAIYQQVAKILEGEIRTNFKVGDFLPSEWALAKRFSVNRHTLRRAVDELVHSGMVLRQHGRGTIVVDNRIEYSIRKRARFTESLKEMGLKPEARVVRQSLTQVDEAFSRDSGFLPGTNLLELCTLRTVDGEPICIISHFLDIELVPGLADQYREGSLHAYLESTYGYQVQRRAGYVSARLPDSEDATWLNCSQMLPVLVVRSHNITQTGKPIEYSVSRSRSDRFEMKVAML
ncbi:MAG: phosphonate metabolism transcriptional regulator PhnF [Pseudomonadales bacterium]|uniref:DNA-binding transcriptional regulator of phosphonate uptake and biodegradation n=1 Tax=Oleiphilus messinensis TaxID=141451 RepID=A0A1Y0IFX7_9GAMM|nr:phosphonate metabolism transcriptional regulator PhnF [Oleiphilus messinensis]ARU59422.1 DNA-binding transcriptional regulator of phosphonate uptake and biodegradation [Oleiphilus messinensis]MCG8610841.1 phosphonate metabolism transcriptional regulator PhnF [Pseudomonadales bacterium]